MIFPAYMSGVCPGCNKGALIGNIKGYMDRIYADSCIEGERANLNGKGGCSSCECEHCGYTLLGIGMEDEALAVRFWRGTCIKCGKDTLHETCRKAVGKRIRFTGTNGNEYDTQNHGKPVEGTGFCVCYHNSHGLCIIVQLDRTNGKQLCIDPITVEILS